MIGTEKGRGTAPLFLPLLFPAKIRVDCKQDFPGSRAAIVFS